jgi:superfamily II DNA/RNA helicase
VHVDQPAEHKAYLHRSGRTARAGSVGDVVTLMLPEERGDVRDLTRKARISARPQDVRPGDAVVSALVGEVAAHVEPAPVQAPQQPSRAGSGGGQAPAGGASRRRRSGRGRSGGGGAQGGQQQSGGGAGAGGGTRSGGRGGASTGRGQGGRPAGQGGRSGAQGGRSGQSRGRQGGSGR